MNSGRSRKWSDWRHHIAGRCDALTREMTPPISLRDIFAKCHIKKVVFQPLLLEGALAVDEDGFVVFANCNENLKNAYQSAFEVKNQAGRYLPGRIRFSLAHELIHTFFYNTKQRPFANRLKGTHAKEIESLESACNFGASHILLPTRSLKSDTYKRDVLAVDDLTYLAERYQVSYECLINRLEHLEEWTPRRGLIAIVRRSTEAHCVKAVAKSVAVRGLFESVNVGADFERAFGGIPFEQIKKLPNGAFNFDLAAPRMTGFSIAKCRMEYRWVGNTPQTFVVTLSVSDLEMSTNRQKPSNDHHHLIAKLREAIE